MVALAERPECFGSCIFCDDIRHEIDNKQTYVGCYEAVMVVHVPFPATLPKFCIAVTFFQRRSDYTSDLEVKVFMPGDEADKPSVNIPLHHQLPPPTDLTGNDPLPGAEYALTKTQFVFSPFVIKETGAIRVRMMRSGIMHPLGALQVVTADRLAAMAGDVAKESP